MNKMNNFGNADGNLVKISNGEIVSRVINNVNAIAKDTHVSKRWILSILRSKSASYIAQKWVEGTLFDDEALFAHINCVEMIQVRSIDCCVAEFRMCSTLMRSKHRVPGLIITRNGPAILSITNADRSIYFTKINPRTYLNTKKRKYADKEKYVYYYQDGYIWIPDTHIELINIDAITLKKEEALKLSACAEENKGLGCPNVWEDEFVCPDKLREFVVKETIQEVMLRVQVPRDDNPDMNASISPSR